MGYGAVAGKRPMMPRTLEELKEFIRTKGIPVRGVKVCIEKDDDNPNVIGIFLNHGSMEWTVYENDEEGLRDVTYQGKSEEIAIWKIWTKIMEAAGIVKAKTVAAQTPVYLNRHCEKSLNDSKYSLYVKYVVIIFLTWAALHYLPALFASFASYGNVFGDLGKRMIHPNGYVLYDDGYYYSADKNWWEWDVESSKWKKVSDNVKTAGLDQNFYSYQISEEKIRNYGMEAILEKWKSESAKQEMLELFVAW